MIETVMPWGIVGHMPARARPFLFGSSLTGHTREQCVFLLYGHGANGKSLFLGVLHAMMGQYGGGVPFALFDAEQHC